MIVFTLLFIGHETWMIENCLLRTGGCDTARDKRRRMERCVYANGWGAMETANEQRLLYFC